MSESHAPSPNATEPEPSAEPREGIFRLAAVEAARAPRRSRGEVLRIAPMWLHAAYWILVGALVLMVVVAGFAQINEYATGPALISASSKRVVTPRSSGIVAAVLVSPGQPVNEGDVLLRLNDEQELAELARLDAEFEQQLARSLLERSDRVAREALVGLRAQRDLAKAKVLERQVRAPSAGRVSAVRTRPGQFVEAGLPVISLLDQHPHFRVTAFLPGASRPELSVGLPMQLELTGYAYAYQHLRITEVSSQVIGPTEARRFIGPDLADTLVVTGPVTLVQADLEGSFFTIDGKELAFHDGMPAVAEVPVRQVRLVVLLLPWLRRLF